MNTREKIIKRMYDNYLFSCSLNHSRPIGNYRRFKFAYKVLPFDKLLEAKEFYRDVRVKVKVFYKGTKVKVKPYCPHCAQYVDKLYYFGYTWKCKKCIK